MGVNTTTINKLLKEVYSTGNIEKMFNEEVGALKRIKKSPEKPLGRGIKIPINLEGNERGQGSQNELEALREPNYQVTEEFTILPKVFTHAIRVSGLSLEVGQGGESSYAKTLVYQTDEGLKDAMKEKSAQFFRDGSGKLAQVNGAVVNSTTVTFNNGVPTHFRVGMYVDIINAGNVKQVNSIKITDVDIANNQIILASNQSCDDDSFIYREDVADNAPTDGKELAGTKLLVDNGTLSTNYQGLSRVTYPQIDGITIDAGGANLSNDLLERAISRVKILSSGKMPNLTISNTSQFRKYLTVLTPMKQFESKEKMDSGYETVPTWNGKEWLVDTDCDFDRVYMIHTDYYKRYVVTDLAFDEKFGQMLKWDPGFDAGVAYAKSYENLGSNNPKAHVAITNLATPTF